MRRFTYPEPALKWIYYDIDTAPPEVRNALHNLGLLQNCKAPVLRPHTLLLDKLINSWNGSYFDTLHSNFTISAEAIHSITGLPIDGRLVSSHEMDETAAQQAVIHELSGTSLKLVKGKIPLDQIRKPLNYWVCGLLYSRCARVCRRSNLVEFGLGKIGVEISEGGRINWCQLVADQLFLSLEACRQGTSNSFSFVTILQGWVYDHFPLVQPRWGPFPTAKNAPTLCKWRAIDMVDIIRDNIKKKGKGTSDRACINFFGSRETLVILEPYGFPENFEKKKVHCKSERRSRHSPIELVGVPIGINCERANSSSLKERTLSCSSSFSEEAALSATGRWSCEEIESRLKPDLASTYNKSKRKSPASPQENSVDTLVSKRSSTCDIMQVNNSSNIWENARGIENACSLVEARKSTMTQEMNMENPSDLDENGGVGGKGEPANFVNSFVIFCNLVILNDFATGCNYVDYGLTFLGETTKIPPVDFERMNIFNQTENEEPEFFRTLEKGVCSRKEAEGHRNFQSLTLDNNEHPEEQILGKDVTMIQEEIPPEGHKESSLITSKHLEELKEQIRAEEKAKWESWKDYSITGMEGLCDVVDRIMDKLKENMAS